MYVSNSLISHSIDITTSSELLLVKIDCTQSLYCCCIYIPPNSPPIVYHNLFTSLTQYFNSSPVLLLGDFNLPDVCWSSLSSSSISGSIMCDYLFDLNLSQTINKPTSIHGSILDLVITNHPEPITSTTINNYLSLSDHFPISFEFKLLEQVSNLPHFLTTPKQTLMDCAIISQTAFFFTITWIRSPCGTISKEKSNMLVTFLYLCVRYLPLLLQSILPLKLDMP